jgi:hypothetical protein
VANVLAEQGYEVTPEFGQSTLKVNLAVKHPQNKQQYLLAIEIDSTRYHLSQVSRDRERLVNQVLRLRGWSTYRIWSPDWVWHREEQKVKLEAYLQDILHPKATDKPEEGKTVVPILTKVFVPETVKVEFPVFPGMTEILQLRTGSKSFGVFLKQFFLQVCPISEKDFKTFIGQVLGVDRWSVSVERSLKVDLDPLLVQQVISLEDGFYYLVKKDVIFRQAKSGSYIRDAKNLCDREIIDGLSQIIGGAQEIEVLVCYRTFAKFCGYEVVSANLKNQLGLVLEQMQEQGLVRMEDNRIKWIKQKD